MAQSQTALCDFCPPGKDSSPATIQIFVDSEGKRVQFDACVKCAQGKLGQLSEKLTPKKPAPSPAG